jgi:hypothetical protein
VAGREGVAPPDPYRVLQVRPEACPEVVEAAFGALREMILRSDADDAPARLAELNLARRMAGERAAAERLPESRVQPPHADRLT